MRTLSMAAKAASWNALMSVILEMSRAGRRGAGETIGDGFSKPRMRQGHNGYSPGLDVVEGPERAIKPGRCLFQAA